MGLAYEEHQLQRADEFILLAREHIERQGEIIAKLTRDGLETTDAVNLLETLHKTVFAMSGYRELVAEHIARLKKPRKEN
jgi:hypothetical protein